MTTRAIHKLATWLLLCLAALPFIFSICIQTSRFIIHHEIREQLEQNNLVTILIHKSEVTWTEPGKEAIVGGDMFDVKKFVVKGDEVQLTGLFDKDEDALVTQLCEHEKNNPDANDNTLILEWFSFFSYVQDSELNELFCVEKSCITVFPQQDRIQSPVLSCDTPPPETAFI